MHYRSQKKRDAEKTGIATSEDGWEKWEFGNETFIDRALKEPMQSLPKAGCVPLKNGVPHYLEAIRTLRPFISTERQAKIDEVLAWRSGSVRVVIEDPINPSNAWACLRTMDSYGVQYVDIVSNPENYREKEENQRRKRMKTAMGAQKWLDLESFEDTGQCAQQLKDEGYTILATDLSEGAVPIHEVDFDAMGKFAVVFGNEENGITEEMRSLCDKKVYLPMRGFAQSFSLSVSCAAMLSHLSAVGALRPGSLGPEERARVLFKWSLDSVRAGRGILRKEGFDVAIQGQGKRILGYTPKTRRGNHA